MSLRVNDFSEVNDREVSSRSESESEQGVLVRVIRRET